MVALSMALASANSSSSFFFPRARRPRYLIRFLQWLVATRYIQVLSLESPRNEPMLLNTVTKTS